MLISVGRKEIFVISYDKHSMLNTATWLKAFSYTYDDSDIILLITFYGHVVDASL